MKRNQLMEKVRQTAEYKEAAFDENLSKEYAEGLVENCQGRCDKYTKRMSIFDGYDLQDAYENGLRKSRELEVENAMRFAEWTCNNGWDFFEELNVWFGGTPQVRKTTEELYNSQAFLDYLKQFEK